MKLNFTDISLHPAGVVHGIANAVGRRFEQLAEKVNSISNVFFTARQTETLSGEAENHGRLTLYPEKKLTVTTTSYEFAPPVKHLGFDLQVFQNDILAPAVNALCSFAQTHSVEILFAIASSAAPSFSLPSGPVTLFDRIELSKADLQYLC